jgi:hypothetical protein
MNTNKKVSLKNILIGVALFLLVGSALLAIFGKKGQIHVPTSFEVGNKSGLLMGLVGAYIIFSIVLLWVFFEPKTPQGIGATIGAGILWGIL